MPTKSTTESELNDLLEKGAKEDKQESPPVDTKTDKTETEVQEEAPPAISRDQEALERLRKTIGDALDATTIYTRCTLYGDVGGGKTVAAADAPKPILIAIERGNLSLINHPSILKNGIEVMTFKTVTQVEDFARFHREGKFPEFKTIILDTFSELQWMALDKRVQKKFDENPNLRDPYTPEGKDFQGNTSHMRRIAAAFRDVEANVIFVCHERDDEVAGEVIRRPSPTYQVNKALNQYCDIVAYMWTEWEDEEEIFLSSVRTFIANGIRITAKSRIGGLPQPIKNLTFNMLHEHKIKKIEEARKVLAKS